ncbi:hypothetical protein RM572_13485 [Streptomyces sp. DSM 42041]|uniref:Secreted protein n=1 Tax=Streptomyces hazeniae TaxID=3075538 RepID=A0ABU2NUU2_9ACTN|nr:hypothetical protein [Streptomyces sp. DSM 42041]MDT0379772.1 hypothetical protein [Streptomyces sp. DSM 42041]
MLTSRVRRHRALSGAVALLAMVGLGAASGPAGAAPAGPAKPGQEVSWRAELGVRGGDDVGVRFTDGALRLRAEGVRPASAGGEGAQGAAVLPVRELGRTVHRVSVDLQARTPQGTRVAVDVRGRGAGGVWTEWREAAAGAPALLPRAASSVQARVTLFGMADGSAGPVVEGLRLSAEAVPASERAKERPQAAAAFSATVFATREGLVGHTTANGHVIQPNDHFVALPSRRGLSPRGSHEYSVRVCGPARCETAPVWDVGPWNTKDDYWNPSSVREMWKDLPQGRPEAQAAYQDDYNGGADQFGRQVANPAGIDLADGTFYNVGLNDNGWVTVTYLWTGGGGSDTKPFPTWGSDVNIREQATTNSASVASLPGPTTVNVQCQKRGQMVHYQGYSNDAWSYLPDYGGYISNIFVDVADSWLPGVPTC